MDFANISPSQTKQSVETNDGHNGYGSITSSLSSEVKFYYEFEWMFADSE